MDRLLPQRADVFMQPVSVMAWEEIPSSYVLCERDHAIKPSVQEAMAARASSVHRLDSDHSPFLSMPKQTAELIRDLILS